MSDRKILDAIRIAAGTYKKDGIEIYFGQVTEIDLSNTVIHAPSCTVSIKNDVPLINVALQSSFSDGLLLVPTIGSQVVVLRSRDNPYPVIIMTSDLDAIYMQVQDSWIVNWGQNGEDSDFNSKSFGGLVKLVDPNDTNAGVLARLNKLEQDINNLKNAMSTWVPVAQDGGAALKSAAGSWFGQQLTPTQRGDLENKKITMGE